ncbi:hypothetical protein RQP46_000374 [Phenoliferia psychrophenolica]
MNAAKAKAAQRAQKLAALKGKGKEYWGDGVSTITAPGGGILRIGYDQARFEQAVKEVIIEPEDLSKKADAATAGADESTVVDVKVEAVKVEVKKEDIALVVKELELTPKDAEAALRKVGGDLAKALWELSGPQPIPVFKQGPGGRPALGVAGAV